MIFKFLLVCAATASASALLAPATAVAAYGSPYGAYGSHYGAYGSPYSAYPAQPAVTTQHQNILRTPWNLGQVTSFSKTVDTPYSSVSKSDVRVSNPGIAVGGLGVPAYGALPAYHGYPGYAAPAVGLGYGHAYAAPVAKVAAAPGLLGVAYSAAPSVSHMTYTNGLGLAYAW